MGLYVYMWGQVHILHMFVSIYVYMNICMYVCVCIYAILMYIFRYVHKQICYIDVYL